MRLADHKRILEEEILKEREACAKIAEEWAKEVGAKNPKGDDPYTNGMTLGAGGAGHYLAQQIRARTIPFKGFIRPETAEKHPEMLEQGYRVAGQGLSADGKRIIGNGRGSESPVSPRLRGSETLLP